MPRQAQQYTPVPHTDSSEREGKIRLRADILLLLARAPPLDVCSDHVSERPGQRVHCQGAAHLRETFTGTFLRLYCGGCLLSLPVPDGNGANFGKRAKAKDAATKDGPMEQRAG